MIAVLINLDRSPERLAFFTAQAGAARLTFERLRAVDGRDLSPADLAAVVTPRFDFYPINAGETGLFLSHRAAWQRIVDHGGPYGAVFEDDAVLAASLGDMLARLEAARPDADVIKLETTRRSVVLAEAVATLPSGHALRPLLTWHGGTAGYVVSRSGAQQLLQATHLLADPVDQVLFNPLSRVGATLLILQAAPALCIQRNILERHDDDSPFGTTIGRHRTRGRLWRHGPWIDLRRTFKKLLERRRRIGLSRQAGHQLLTVPWDQPAAPRDPLNRGPKA